MTSTPGSPRAVASAVAIAIVALLPAGSAQAQITEFALEVVESPALGGRHFGAAGQYEWLRGVVAGAIDPADARHRHIVNLDRAPPQRRRARGVPRHGRGSTGRST